MINNGTRKLKQSEPAVDWKKRDGSFRKNVIEPSRAYQIEKQVIWAKTQ